MKDFHKEGKLKKIMQTKPFLILLGIVFIFFSYNMVSFVRKMSETSKNRRIVEEKIDNLETSKKKLEEDISKLQTDRGIEESIREKFGLAEEGENLIMIVDDKGTSEENIDENNTLWKTVKSWFR